MSDSLLQHIETAPEPSRELFEEAFQALGNELFSWEQDYQHPNTTAFLKWRRFDMMLDAQAWTSAAEMLVPEGWSFSTMRPASGNMCYAAVWPKPKSDDEHNTWNGYAAHPSLALLAAILRAERKDDE